MLDVLAMKPHATEHYEATQKRIAKVLEDIQAKAKAHAARQAKQPENWGYVGDLIGVEQRLNEVLSMFP